MAGNTQTRRAFLLSLTLPLLGLAGLWRFLTPTRVPGSRRLSVPVSDVPHGGALVLPEDGVAVTRSAGGELNVLSLTCTHLGCRVNATEAGFVCPCHGSRFDHLGQVQQGPAQAPLRQVAHAQDAGVLRITV